MNPSHRYFMNVIRLFAIACILNISIVFAQVPRTISVQGIINSDNINYSELHVLTTKLFEHETIVYLQQDTIRLERDGLFTIVLGKSNGLPSTLRFDKQYLIEYAIDGQIMPMRMPLHTVPYAFTSENVSENSIDIQHLSAELKRVLNLTNPSEIEKMEKTLANYVGGFKSVIAGGDENRTSANYSSILGGGMNNVSGSYGTVTGGQSNFASGGWSFSGGGQNNRAQASYSASISGMNNIVTSSATYGIISGGNNNQVGGSYGSIGGGQSNVAGTLGTTVSGGVSNRAMQSYATVSGGQNNIANGAHAAIGGGNNNSATNQGSTISGGISNKSIGSNATVSGGMNNEANGASSTISGGMNNEANADNSVISGGSDNTISSGSRNSMISGGMKNIINSGTNNGIIGSSNTLNSGNNSYVFGTSNSVNSGQNSITMGNGNQVSGQNTVAIGTGNIAGLQNEVVVGTYNHNSNNPANTTNQDFIGNRRFTVGIGNSASQRKNGMTIFENGNTLFQGKILTTGTAYVHSVEVANDAMIGGNVNVVGNTNMNGTLQVTGTINGSNLSGTNTGDITIGTASGLSLTGQALSLAIATITDAGAMSSSDKTKLNSIATGAEVNVNADWNAVTGDAEILNKPTLGTMSAETASDYYTKTQTDAGFQVKDADLTTVATIGTNDQLLKVKNDGSGLEWFTPSYISSYTETDPQVGTIATSSVPRWNGTALVTGSLTDDGTNLTTSGTITASNLTGTNTGDITIGTASGLSLTGQALSLATATTTAAGAMSASDKTKLDGITGTGGNGFTHWIGEQYGGGVIFHLYKDNQGVEHGLILALNNQSSSQSWSNVIQEIGANAQNSWNGATNSNAIVSQSGHTNSAAKLCIDLVSGGQNDWYMPSIQELSLLWNNYFTVASSLTQITGAQLLSTYYWSSSEYCADYGWYIDFTNGNTDYNYKTNATNIRAIRAF